MCIRDSDSSKNATGASHANTAAPPPSLGGYTQRTGAHVHDNYESKNHHHRGVGRGFGFGFSGSGGGGGGDNGGPNSSMSMPSEMDALLAAMGGVGPVNPNPRGGGRGGGAAAAAATARSARGDGGEEEAADAEECCVCLDLPRGSVLVPCGHTNLCMPCAQELIGAPLAAGESPLCPSCREPVLQMFKALV